MVKELKLSIVIPCLNEKDTIAVCIRKCFLFFKQKKINGEIIIADNGSTDGSDIIALKSGAKVVKVVQRGYGAAIKEGVKHAKSKYILIADADDSYNFLSIKKFYTYLEKGFDLVQGTRFGKGKVNPGAMPLLHQYLGNPFFSLIFKLFYQVPVNDIYCGMRAFRKDKFDSISFFSDDMTFAVEHILKFHFNKYKIKEIPIRLFKDGRISTKKHLKTFTDGLKTLKLFLIFLPKKFYFFASIIPLFYIFIKLFYSFINNNNFNLNSIDILIYFLISFQIFMFGLFTSTLSSLTNFSNDKKIFKFLDFFNLKKSLIICSVFLFSSFILLINKIKNLFLIYFSDKDLNLLSLLLFYIFVLIFFSSLHVSLLDLVRKSTLKFTNKTN